jgi:hypothetical protein
MRYHLFQEISKAEILNRNLLERRQKKKENMMERALKEQLIELVDNVMVDPDIDIEYFIPDDQAVASSDIVISDPYVLVKYSEDSYTERKISLREEYIKNSAQNLANYITFHIEQFKEELDSLHYGAQ